nr:MAG TPA_asm: hypothetical protein [Caudoviricetes sp.]
MRLQKKYFLPCLMQKGSLMHLSLQNLLLVALML